MIITVHMEPMGGLEKHWKRMFKNSGLYNVVLL